MTKNINIAKEIKLAVKYEANLFEMPGLEENMGDLGLDSLDKIELAMRLEEEFTIEIRDEEITNETTVEELIALVESRI